MLMVKGLIIGLGKIIPGVSGSMLAISLGVYQEMIDSINNFFKDIKKNFFFLFKIGIGVLLSIILFSKLIMNSLKISYITTIFFFIGLIIGSIDDIKENINSKNRYISIIFFIIVLLFGLFSINNDVNIDNSILYVLYYILMGFIDAITMIIPGISGTATLMMLGAYNSLIGALSSITNISSLNDNLRLLIPFVIGMILGIIFTAKLVDYLFKKYKSKTYSAILGFTFSTIILMALKCLKTNYSFLELVLAILLLLVGVFITKRIKV